MRAQQNHVGPSVAYSCEELVKTKALEIGLTMFYLLPYLSLAYRYESATDTQVAQFRW
jgi:hypothetical protein